MTLYYKTNNRYPIISPHTIILNTHVCLLQAMHVKFHSKFFKKCFFFSLFKSSLYMNFHIVYLWATKILIFEDNIMTTETHESLPCVFGNSPVVLKYFKLFSDKWITKQISGIVITRHMALGCILVSNMIQILASHTAINLFGCNFVVSWWAVWWTGWPARDVWLKVRWPNSMIIQVNTGSHYQTEDCKLYIDLFPNTPSRPLVDQRHGRLMVPS